ncbi:MAG: Phosphoglycolate phosphatase [Betaproteobacteria bacterium ADurb.Bin341]|nr:MAG: Phosphoglycolate phosphatase [Betaproteobacteria bacterium ADurb.Bin341]
MKVRSVTFDLDGTLLDTLADLTEACQTMLTELRQPLRQREEIVSFVGNGMAVLVERCLTREEPPSETELAAAIASFRRHYTEVNGRNTRFYPGVQEGLQLFRNAGFKMAVVTNKPAEFTGMLLERMGVSGIFDAVVCGDTTAFKKPHPEPIHHACRLMGTHPGENLHIGDSINDIQSARAAGSVVFYVPYGYHEGDPVDSADCDALVSDLVAAFERLNTF